MKIDNSQLLLYLISFLVLFFAEICATLHSLYTIRGKKHKVALFSAIGSVCWCIKIAVVVNQPWTIITAFIGAYVGTLLAFYIENKLK